MGEEVGSLRFFGDQSESRVQPSGRELTVTQARDPYSGVADVISNRLGVHTGRLKCSVEIAIASMNAEGSLRLGARRFVSRE